MTLQSCDTANKSSELSDFSVSRLANTAGRNWLPVCRPGFPEGHGSHDVLGLLEDEPANEWR